MCLIVKKPEGLVIPDKNLIASYDHNSDGWGLMYSDGERVHCQKGLGYIDDCLNSLDNLKHRTVYVHMRYATHGTVSVGNAHPFCILDYERDGLDLYMMHNGVLYEAPTWVTDRSDTYHYAMMLRGMFNDDPTLLDDADFWEAFSKDTKGNKFIFLFGSGREIIVNEHEGSEIDGLWYSNTYSLTAWGQWKWKFDAKTGWQKNNYDDEDDWGAGWEKDYNRTKSGDIVVAGGAANDGARNEANDAEYGEDDPREGEFPDFADDDDLNYAEAISEELESGNTDPIQILGAMKDRDIDDLACYDPQAVVRLLQAARDHLYA